MATGETAAAGGGSEVIMTGEAGLPHEPSPRTAQPPLHVIMKTVAPHLTLVHSIAGPCVPASGTQYSRLCACFQPHCLSLEMSVAFSPLRNSWPVEKILCPVEET